LAIHRTISFSETTGVEVVLTLSNIERSGGTSSANWRVQSSTNKETGNLGPVASGFVSTLLGPSEASVLPGRTAEDVLPKMVSIDEDLLYGGLDDLGSEHTGIYRFNLILSPPSLCNLIAVKLDHFQEN
jgi:hybrid polyketide synthase/nonribosomal peptide synthetase ACE1